MFKVRELSWWMNYAFCFTFFLLFYFVLFFLYYSFDTRHSTVRLIRGYDSLPS